MSAGIKRKFTDQRDSRLLSSSEEDDEECNNNNNCDEDHDRDYALFDDDSDASSADLFDNSRASTTNGNSRKNKKRRRGNASFDADDGNEDVVDLTSPLAKNNTKATRKNLPSKSSKPQQHMVISLVDSDSDSSDDDDRKPAARETTNRASSAATHLVSSSENGSALGAHSNSIIEIIDDDDDAHPLHGIAPARAAVASTSSRATAPITATRRTNIQRLTRDVIQRDLSTSPESDRVNKDRPRRAAASSQHTTTTTLLNEPPWFRHVHQPEAALTVDNSTASTRTTRYLDSVDEDLSHEKKQEIYSDARRPAERLQEELEHLYEQLRGIGHNYYQRTANRDARNVCQQQIDAIKEQLRTARQNAAQDIYNRNNSAGDMGNMDANGRLSIDFHGLYVKEAIAKFTEIVMPILPVQKEVVIITGKGNHSHRHGKSKIQDGLITHIQRTAEFRKRQMHYHINPRNTGQLIVRL